MSTAIDFPGMNAKKKMHSIRKEIDPMNSENILLTNKDLLKYKEEVPIKMKSSKRKSSRGKTVKKRKRAVKSHDRRPVSKLRKREEWPLPRRKTKKQKKQKNKKTKKEKNQKNKKR